jgi:hypothetical protein
MFPKVGWMFPKVGWMFPKVGWMLPTVGWMFPKVVWMFPKVVWMFPKVGWMFPTWLATPLEPYPLYHVIWKLHIMWYFFEIRLKNEDLTSKRCQTRKVSHGVVFSNYLI